MKSWAARIVNYNKYAQISTQLDKGGQLPKKHARNISYFEIQYNSIYIIYIYRMNHKHVYK